MIGGDGACERVAPQAMVGDTLRIMETTSTSERVSAELPDWSREELNRGRWEPSRKLLASLRDYQRLSGKSGPATAVTRKIAVLRHRFWSAVTGADIPLNCHIEGGLLLPHPSGVVIHPDARIGPNCLLMQGVTVGSNRQGVPTLKGHVDVGPGAKILGKLVIGEHAVVGANAVVLQDVPDGTVVVGVPAKVIRQQGC